MLVPLRPNLYAFGFGDLDERTGEISDTIISNNGDGAKVLATVAAIIHDFTMVFQDAAIYVEGSTPARTRWYQMNINAFWHDISCLFKIYGSVNNEWEPFRRGINYSAFIGQRR